MLVFDNKTLRILKYIHRHTKNGLSWEALQKKFGEDEANIFLLEQLNKEMYILTKNTQGEWIDFNEPEFGLESQFVSFATPKTNDIIERTRFDFWKWMIPTLISVAALLISIIALNR
jgi:hypothetical protein